MTQLMPFPTAKPALRIYRGPAQDRGPVLEDVAPAKPRAPKRRRKPETATKPAPPSPSAATPPAATPRRHLAGADWLSAYPLHARKAK
jgi:hypothetical protein